MNTLSFLRRNLLVLVALFVCGSLTNTSVHAQPSGARNTDFIYRVVLNDTLIDLAERYTNSHQNWRELQILNQVDDTLQLSIGRYLRIPFVLIPELPS